MKKYSLTDEQKMRFAGLYLLEYMINTPHAFSLFLDGNDEDLESILEWLLAQNYVQIKDNEKYIPTPEGRKELEKFMARYSEYLTMFDIFSAVDLEKGKFAFSKYFKFDTDEEWQKYLHKKRWEDLRVAVADFKKMDPVEIVFMSFISEHRFGRDASGWQFDLLLGSVWDEILEICNSAIQWEDLEFEDEEGIVPAEEVITDIIQQGTEIMLKLLREEEKRSDFHSFTEVSNGEADDEFYVDRVNPPDYDMDHYQRYQDPYYKSSSWRN